MKDQSGAHREPSRHTHEIEKIEEIIGRLGVRRIFLTLNIVLLAVILYLTFITKGIFSSLRELRSDIENTNREIDLVNTSIDNGFTALYGDTEKYLTPSDLVGATNDLLRHLATQDIARWIEIDSEGEGIFLPSPNHPYYDLEHGERMRIREEFAENFTAMITGSDAELALDEAQDQVTRNGTRYGKIVFDFFVPPLKEQTHRISGDDGKHILSVLMSKLAMRPRKLVISRESLVLEIDSYDVDARYEIELAVSKERNQDAVVDLRSVRIIHFKRDELLRRTSAFTMSVLIRVFAESAAEELQQALSRRFSFFNLSDGHLEVGIWRSGHESPASAIP